MCVNRHWLLHHKHPHKYTRVDWLIYYTHVQALSKAVPVYAMKGFGGGGGGITPLVLNLELDGPSAQLHVPVTLPWKKPPWYPPTRWMGGTHSQFGHFEKAVKLVPLLGLEPQFLRGPAHSPVTLLTTLPWVHCTKMDVLLHEIYLHVNTSCFTFH
jgi:hypothetical protein